MFDINRISTEYIGKLTFIDTVRIRSMLNYFVEWAFMTNRLSFFEFVTCGNLSNFQIQLLPPYDL